MPCRTVLKLFALHYVYKKFGFYLLAKIFGVKFTNKISFYDSSHQYRQACRFAHKIG